MRRSLYSLLALSFLGVVVVGCGHTRSGGDGDCSCSCEATDPCATSMPMVEEAQPETGLPMPTPKKPNDLPKLPKVTSPLPRESGAPTPAPGFAPASPEVSLPAQPDITPSAPPTDAEPIPFAPKRK